MSHRRWDSGRDEVVLLRVPGDLAVEALLVAHRRKTSGLGIRMTAVDNAVGHFEHIVGMAALPHRIAAHWWNEPRGRLRVMDVRNVGGPKTTFFPGAPDQVIGDVADHVVSAHSIPAPIRRTVPVKIERKLEVGNLPGK